ncbi:hypothetical protein EOL96_04395 [Candidatus Saccharibacteria bacterium]|nr:hypothetical protein [Candidatus Saccharibacteria bacterium]
MTELDFEELDKAVNTLMSGVDTSKRTPGLDDPEDKVVTLSMDADDKSSVAKQAAPSQGASPLAVKRRGQFMDVIHPSSNMKVAPQPVSRQGVAVQPTTATVKPSELPADTTEDEPDKTNELKKQDQSLELVSFDMESTGNASESADKQSSDSTDDAAAKPGVSEWPDPIDMANNMAVATDSNDDATSDDASSTDQLEASSEKQPELVPADNVPLSSPFLSGTKVEKRPLGGATAPFVEDAPSTILPADEVAVEKLQNTLENSSTEPEPETEPSTKQPNQLPEELKDDVVAVESIGTGGIIVGDDHQVVSPVHANGSITQQYKEKPSTSGHTSTPIYDTATHVQPLIQPKPKKSTLKWVLVVLLLAIIGGIGGAAYYYFTH